MLKFREFQREFQHPFLLSLQPLWIAWQEIAFSIHRFPRLYGRKIKHRHPFSKACLQHSQTVIQPCMWFLEEPSQFSVGQTAQSLTCSIMEKPYWVGWLPENAAGMLSKKDVWLNRYSSGNLLWGELARRGLALFPVQLFPRSLLRPRSLPHSRHQRLCTVCVVHLCCVGRLRRRQRESEEERDDKFFREKTNFKYRPLEWRERPIKNLVSTSTVKKEVSH